MSDEPAPAPDVAPPRRRHRWWRWLAGGVAALLALVLAVLATVDSDLGHRWVADRIGAIRTPTGLRFTVGRIDGSLYGRAQLHDVRVYDLDGLLLQIPDADLDWRPWRWFSNELAIRSLAVPRATLFHAPHTRRTGRRGPVLPSFDIAIGRLRVDRLVLASGVLGQERVGRVDGTADIHSGRARIALDGVVAGSDRLHLRLDAEPDHDRFDVDAQAAGARGGVLARLVGASAPVTLTIGGNGRWTHWRGTAQGSVGATRAVDLSLSNDAGRYALGGTLVLAPLTQGKLQRLTAPRVLVTGRATYADRQLDGTLALRSAALAAVASGGIDLAESAYRQLRVRARLLRPAALFPNMTGNAIELRAILDGAFATARFDYRLDARRFAFDDTGFEDAHARGAGRLSRAPVTLPVAFTAARVTGVGEVAGGILHRLSIAGDLHVTPALLTGERLRLRSDKLSGLIDLTLDLKTGEYQVGASGALGRYLIPGLGIVDVQSHLRAVPGPGGHGLRLVGTGAAQVERLDNAFFRGLAGGLPRITTGLERTPDGILHFTDLRLAAPAIRLQATGYRRRDGSFHLEGTGTQTSYGPFRLVLDGQIDHPTIDLQLAHPNAALGLTGVRAHLDPTPDGGFAFRAAGNSRLGAFTTAGAILLPRQGQAAIRFDQLHAGNLAAQGTLAIVTGGFDGTLTVGGQGRGTLAFSVVGGNQQVVVDLLAAGARLDPATQLRRGRLEATILLDPAGTRIDATATGQGLRRGALRLARFVVSTRLVGGAGTVRAEIAGTHGRAFDVQAVADVAADRVSAQLGGTLDGRPLRLTSPAVLTRAGTGWQLAPTTLAFAGGQATLGGRYADGAVAVDARLADMPLAILDIGYPGLGLGGTASGRVAVAASAGAAPTGRLGLQIRGLTRSGLVLTSRPIDMGVAGVLSPTTLGLRAVMGSGGKLIGRAQARLSLPANGPIAARMAAAGLFAQLRYAGPADTLWRLTGLELFDLSGPVAIGADVTGSVARPSIRGAVQATGARIESATTGTVLTGVEASGTFAGSRLQIDRFAADAGRGGRVTGTGAFDFAAAHGVGLDIHLQADHAQMINRDDIAATVTGPLSFRSDGAGGTIAGDVVLDRSRYRLGQATAATAVPTLNLREINLPGGDAEEDEAPPSPWQLRLTARAPNGLIVSGLGLSSEWSADLRIGGAPDNPAITGVAKLVRGDVEFSGREFQLERGIIRFGGEAPANPVLDIAADADTTGLNATIRVTGIALKPEISFTSVPALPEDELLSRLLFGTSITNLSAPEALQLASAVAALQSGGHGLDPINAVRRAAGLDRLRILPADPQTGAGTSIAAGKYVTRRLYAEIVTDGQGYSATQAEFQVTRWLSLLSSISTIGRQSLNVRVSKDY